jgi:hypothetical protein
MKFEPNSFLIYLILANLLEAPPPLTSQIASPPPRSALGAAPHRPRHRLGRNRPAAIGAAMGSELPCFTYGLPGPARVGPARSSLDEQCPLAISNRFS